MVFRGVATGVYSEQRPVAVPDGAGGLLVFSEAAAREGRYAGDWEIIGQRIDAAGKLLWNDGDSSVVVAASTWSERRPVAIPDGRGGAFVFYEAWGPPGSEWEGDVDIRGQRVSGSGELLWGEEGVALADSAMLEQAPCVISDGAGGAIVVLELMLREGEFAGISNIAAQRVSADGELLWAGGEQSVLVAVSEWSESGAVAVPDGAGGALVFFEAAARRYERERSARLRRWSAPLGGRPGVAARARIGRHRGRSSRGPRRQRRCSGRLPGRQRRREPASRLGRHRPARLR